MNRVPVLPTTTEQILAAARTRAQLARMTYTEQAPTGEPCRCPEYADTCTCGAIEVA